MDGPSEGSVRRYWDFFRTCIQFDVEMGIRIGLMRRRQSRHVSFATIASELRHRSGSMKSARAGHDPAYSRSSRSALPWQILARTISLIGADSMKAVAVCVSS